VNAPAFAFRELARHIEELARRELELSPLALPPELAALDGEFRGRPAQLSARAYSGPRHAYARFVELVGDGLEIANVVIVARPELPLPVLGVDLVGLGKEKAVIVADLSPMTDEPGRLSLERAAVEADGARALPPESALELPAWAERWFSKNALCVRVTPSESVAACQVVAEMARAFVELSRAEPAPERSNGSAASVGAPDRRGEVARRQQAYFDAHRADDRGLLLLRRIFEPGVADRFLREVLFPERMPA
jgi:ferredoxin-dependent bilin reductase